MTVLCLIANPEDRALDSALAGAVLKAVGGELNWLAHGIACEIVAPKSTDALAEARDLVAGRPVDAAVVPADNRRKRLLLADMDSTMINEECIDELAAAVGIKDQVAAITARAMNGEIEFEAALDERVALLRGLELKAIEAVRRERITLAPGGRALVETMKAHGAFTALISGGFTYFADYFGKRIGFDEVTANVLDFEGQLLLGTVRRPIVGRVAKHDKLLELAARHAVPMELTLAVGDGANDLDMLKAAGLGVALHAKPSVAAQADARIDHGDLTALLYLQGYAEDEFVR